MGTRVSVTIRGDRVNCFGMGVWPVVELTVDHDRWCCDQRYGGGLRGLGLRRSLALAACSTGEQDHKQLPVDAARPA